MLAVLVGDAAPAGAQSLARDGRWFTYGGKHIYLIGVDQQEMAADPNLDYAHYLDLLVANHLDKIRIWVDCYFGGPSYLHPWSYDSATGKFDLDSWNAQYWQRMKDFVAAAQSRKIIVEVSLFDVYPAIPSWWTNTSHQVAWNKAFNKNGAFSTNSSGDIYPQMFDVTYSETSSSGKTLAQYQQALVEKTLAELGSYPNVYFEMENEFPGDFQNRGYIDQSYPWLLHWASFVDQHGAWLTSVHAHDSSGQNTRGIQYYWDKPYVDILNFHFYDTDPTSVASLLHPAQVKGKVLQCNESFGLNKKGPDELAREAWAWLMAGGHYALYVDKAPQMETSAWAQWAKHAHALHDIVDTLRFWKLSPVDSSGAEYTSLITAGPGPNWRLLADPGSEYLAYFWGTPRTLAFSMPLQAGDYTYTWYNASDGTVLGTGSVSGATPATIAAPPASWNATVGLALTIVNKATPDAGQPIADAGADGPDASGTPADAGLTDSAEAAAPDSGAAPRALTGGCACDLGARGTEGSPAAPWLVWLCLLSLPGLRAARGDGRATRSE